MSSLMGELSWKDIKERAYTCEASVTDIRALLDNMDDQGDLVMALDEAQGDVFTDKVQSSYVVIRITK
jgi:hypothetical protein